MGSKSKADNPHTGDGASPGKIFIGGLPKDTTYATFNKHFGKYGDITDSVIMKDRYTGQPRGFGFITYADPSVVDKVIEDTHIINGKQVEIKRTIPKGSGQSKDFKTKKIFVGGIPSSVSEDELKNFFSKYGKVLEHQIIRDHETNRSRGFGFVIFDSEEVVDEMLSKGNMIDMAGTQVSLIGWSPVNQLLKGYLFIVFNVLLLFLFALRIYQPGIVYSIDTVYVQNSILVFFKIFLIIIGGGCYRYR
ncbi:RNA-binding (RRM/RBD/RNP motifs) family protein [Citrus sinensis]|nr:RNA-binding (RRM/RBD/RNP motifs) family protein [Citrus sinensis]